MTFCLCRQAPREIISRTESLPLEGLKFIFRQQPLSATARPEPAAKKMTCPALN